jgi:hypothetical protein
MNGLGACAYALIIWGEISLRASHYPNNILKYVVNKTPTIIVCRV